MKGTLGLLNNPRLWPYLAPSFPWPVALAGTQCFFSILPRLLLLTPGVGTRACKEGGTTFSCLPPSLPPSGFFQSGYSPGLLPQPVSSLCPSILFLGDCSPHSCFCNHIHPWSPYLSSQHPLPPSTYWHLLPKYASPLDSTFTPKSCCSECSLFLQRCLPPPRPVSRAPGGGLLLAPLLPEIGRAHV